MLLQRSKCNIDYKVQKLFCIMKIYSRNLFPKAHVLLLHCVLLYCHPQHGTSFSGSETAALILTLSLCRGERNETFFLSRT